MSEVSSTRKLVSASALMASGTMISRVLGVVRVVLIAFILGTGTRQADMFSLATTVPNSLYILFAGGALNTVLVPQIVRAIKKDPDGGEAYTNRIMTAFMLIVTAVAVLVTIAAPLVTMIYTSDGWRAPELASQYASMVTLTYLTLPQIFFYGAFFLLGQVLNARDKFGPMMWAPIANNVVSILVLGVYLAVWGNERDTSGAFTTPQLLVLGLGSTVGIAVQMLVLLPFVKRVGFKLRPRFDLKGTGLGKTFSLTKWTIGFVAVNQLALMVVNRLGTSATAGGDGAGITVYANAHLIWILPHSLITVSLATAMLPSASRLAANGDAAGVAAEFTKTIRLALIVIVPATVAFFALSGPTAGLLFDHGAASGQASMIAWALMAFAVGLVPFTVQFVCLRTFYALENTRTPFFLQVVIAGLNIALGLALVWFADSPAWVASALALAYSVAYLVGVFLSWRALKGWIPQLNGSAIIMHVVRLLLSAGVGGVAAYFLSAWLTDLIPSTILADIVALLAGGLLILGSYLGIGKLLHVRELGSLGDLVRSRLGRRRPAGDPDEDSIEQSIRDEELATIIQPAIMDDLAVTRMNPALDDIGPATIVRNRPPISAHTFDAPVADAVFRRPTEEPEAAEEEDLDPEVPFALPEPIEDEPDETPADADEPTGALDIQGLFRDDASGEAIAAVGTLLNTRYELVERLATRHGTESWRAHDQVLSRDVVVHVIAPGDPRISELLMAARKGAAATDSRFLRVLDADEVTDPDQGIGAYVVAEYASGRSLTDLLTKGPLSAIEAAHIVRELADALVGVHAQGLFHEQLNPDNVVITSAGAVRLVGFGVEATLAGRDDDSPAWAARERADVTGLGKLLYAALVRHWPGGPRWGLPAAPIVAGEPAAPHSVQAGISPALDRICTTTLTERGAASERRISTAAQLVGALTQVLGTADASLDLEQRVRAWQSTDDLPVVANGPAALAGTFDDADADFTTRVEAPRRAEPVEVAPADVPQEGERPRRLLWILLLVAVLTLVGSLIVVGMNNARDNAADPGTSTPPGATGTTSPDGSQSPSQEPIVIKGARDFDPETDGGSGDVNADDVGNVFDGNPDTSWSTERYKRPNMGGEKPGVGVILDLGEVRKVTAAHLVLTGGETSVEVRIPKGETPSMRSEVDWTIVGAEAKATGTATVTLTKPVETRYLMVYFTNLPEVEGGFRGELNEVTLS